MSRVGSASLQTVQAAAASLWGKDEGRKPTLEVRPGFSLLCFGRLEAGTSVTTTYGSVWRTDSKQPCSSSVGGGRAVRGGGELGMCVGPTA